MKFIKLSILATLLLIQGCSSGKKKDEPIKEELAPVEKAVEAHSVKEHKVEKAHWGYVGTEGPEFWASLNEKYKYCKAGKSQSPIDLVFKKPVGGGELDFKYESGKFGVIDNGHTIQVNLPPGNKVIIRGHEYDLLQFHFHSSSEHLLSGNQMPLEVHFVHKDSGGNLAVVGVFFVEGAENSLVKLIWDNIPTQKSVEKMVESSPLNPGDLVPSVRTYYNYYGSLTTPPCSEGVNWNVLNTPLSVSREQIKLFRSYYSNNFRPVQPLNGRKVTNY